MNIDTMGDGDDPVGRKQRGEFLVRDPLGCQALEQRRVTSTMPILEFANPLSISRSNDLPRPTSFSLNQTVAPRDTSRSHNSLAAPCRSSQAWQRKRLRRSGCSRACSSAWRARGSIVRHSAAVYDTEPPPRSRRDFPPLDERPLDEPPPALQEGLVGGA